MFFGITDFWTYVIGAFLIILLPGPNSLYVLTSPPGTACARATGPRRESSSATPC